MAENKYHEHASAWPRDSRLETREYQNGKKKKKKKARKKIIKKVSTKINGNIPHKNHVLFFFENLRILSEFVFSEDFQGFYFYTHDFRFYRILSQRKRRESSTLQNKARTHGEHNERTHAEPKNKVCLCPVEGIALRVLLCVPVDCAMS